MSAFDALFVINQNTNLEAMFRLAEDCSVRRALVLSTHALFPQEENQLKELADEVSLVTFASQLSDEEMAQCDAQASRACLELLDSHGRRGYARSFMQASMQAKNELLRQKVLGRVQVKSIFHGDGLGIDGEVWAAAGSAPLPSLAFPVRRRWHRIPALFQNEIHLVLPRSDSVRLPFLVLGSVRRLKFCADVKVERLNWPFSWQFTPAALNARLLDFMLRRRISGQTYRVCTTIHQYHYGMAELARALGLELHVIADGHHPANYPVSYLEMFADEIFASVNPLSAEWFSLHGRRVCSGLWFQPLPYFKPACCEKMRRIVLVLNHAGDWTALVNRSDTDVLLRAIVNLARRLPSLEFVIRAHPTMATQEHEGVYSMQRISAYLLQDAPPNLILSSASLDEDLQRGDLYLSEYSQVLIDAWASGKLGVVANLTGRRSFMADYEALGFPCVESEEALHEVLLRASTSPEVIVAAQNQAVQRFNDRLRIWHAKERHATA